MMTAIQQLELVQYITSNNELQFPTHLFVNIAAEWVDDLSHSIDELKLYMVKCLPREWAQKSQDAFFEKEGPDRNKKGWKVSWKPVLPFMMNAHSSFLQKEKGTLPTSIIWLDARFASAVEMLPVDNGVGHEK